MVCKRADHDTFILTAMTRNTYSRKLWIMTKTVTYHGDPWVTNPLTNRTLWSKLWVDPKLESVSTDTTGCIYPQSESRIVKNPSPNGWENIVQGYSTEVAVRLHTSVLLCVQIAYRVAVMFSRLGVRQAPLTTLRLTCRPSNLFFGKPAGFLKTSCRKSEKMARKSSISRSLLGTYSVKSRQKRVQYFLRPTKTGHVFPGIYLLHE